MQVRTIIQTLQLGVAAVFLDLDVNLGPFARNFDELQKSDLVYALKYERRIGP